MNEPEIDRLIELNEALKAARRRYCDSLAEKVTPMQLARDVDKAQADLLLHCKRYGLGGL